MFGIGAGRGVKVFPSVPGGAAGVGYIEDGASDTTQSVTVPTTINAGDLLLLFSALDNNATITTITDWTQLTYANGSNIGFQVCWKIADGLETDFTYTTSAASRTINRCYRVINAHRSAAPENTVSNGTSTNADPPELTPTWGSRKTLWFAVAGINGAQVASAYPTNYDDNQYADEVGISVSYASASRELAATSDNPGAFTTTNQAWAASTVAVRPL